MRFTLYGFYKYDPEIFREAEESFPEGFDIDLFERMTLARVGDLYTYHQVPEELKHNIGAWFLINKTNFERILRALSVEYSPIENFDRYESITRSRSNDSTYSDNLTHNLSKEGIDSHSIVQESDTTTLETVTTDSDVLSKISAMNSEALVNDDKSEEESTTTTDGTISRTDETTDSITRNDEETGKEAKSGISEGNEEESIDSHLHGNIGVTTNQQMIDAELELRRRNAYDVFIRMFESEFLVQVY